MIFLFLLALITMFIMLAPKGPRWRQETPQWTKYEDGKPVCGVGRRGYWNSKVTIGGDSPFIQCPHCDEWVPKDTKEHGVVKVVSLNELMERHKEKFKCPKKE